MRPHLFFQTFLIFILIIGFCSCGSSIRSIGIINLTSKEIQIETKPAIRYNGGPEKSIQLLNDSIVWNFTPYGIHAKIIYPDTLHERHEIGRYMRDQVWQSHGIYMMRPISSFRIGSSYMKDTKILSSESVDISYLKIYLQNGDSIVGGNKKEIWKLSKGNKSRKYRKLGKIKKAFRRYEMIILIE